MFIAYFAIIVSARIPFSETLTPQKALRLTFPASISRLLCLLLQISSTVSTPQFQSSTWEEREKVLIALLAKINGNRGPQSFLERHRAEQEALEDSSPSTKPAVAPLFATSSSSRDAAMFIPPLSFRTFEATRPLALPPPTSSPRPLDSPRATPFERISQSICHCLLKHDAGARPSLCF